MIKKENLLDTLKVVEEISKKYNIENKIEELKNSIENFKVKILFIGSFNAGKSALINTLLDDDILIEEQKPETTIATEIIYGEPQRAVLIDKNDNKNVVSIEEAGNNDPTKYYNYSYYLSNEKLLKISDYTIVDMPGFDSGIEEHNKALFRYVEQAAAYIFVIDCEKGTLSQSALNFIKEIKNYHNDIAFIINKCDKKTEKDIESVKNNILSQVGLYFGQDVKIITASKFFDDTEEKIVNLINNFDAQELFERRFSNSIMELLNDLSSALNIIIDSADIDVSEFDNEIAKKEKAKSDLLNNIQQQRKKLSSNLQNNVKMKLIGDIKDALYMNSSVLTSAAISGGDSFSRAVNSILRPILMNNTSQNVEQCYSDFVYNFKIQDYLKDVNVEDMQYILTKLVSRISENKDKNQHGNQLFKGVATTLAVTTSVVAPWIELIIIFLPEIFKLIGFMSESSQRDSLKNKIENEVIPNIIYKIEPSIDQSLKVLEEEMVEDLEEKINNMIENETKALEEVIRRKNDYTEDFHNEIENVRCEVEKIEKLINEIKGE